MQWILCTLLGVIALGPVLWALRKQSLLASALVLTAAVGLSVAGVTWSQRQTRSIQSKQQLLASIPRADRSEDFVTSDTCHSCHPGEHASWHKTYHRSMTQVASRETVKGRFDNTVLELMGETYQLSRTNDEFWVEIYGKRSADAKAVAATPPGASKGELQLKARIGMVTGSHHQQVYWIPTGRGNMQMVLPFTYLLEDQRWVPGNDTFLKSPEAPATMKVWNVTCVECHATAGQARVDAKTRTMDTRVGELGIACESCHGSGVEHVRLNQNPARRYQLHLAGKGDPSIVNPARLSPKSSAQVCGQCHGVKWIHQVQEWRAHGLAYRPGEDLEKTTPIVRATNLESQPWIQEQLKRDPKYLSDRFWSDGMVRVSGREYNGLSESPCFQRGPLQCLSCHSQHNSDPNDQLARRMDTQEACLQCHEPLRNKVEAHTHHRSDSSGSECYNCHMPHTTYGLMKAIRSHKIDSPSVAASQSTGRPNACNLCHLDKTLGWTAETLKTWYGTQTPSLSEEEKSISAALLWLLKGDAGQRALVAWSFGWKPAQKASGESWLAGLLAPLLEDPYAAVRYIAGRSLRSLPAYRDFNYDYLAPDADRAQARQRAATLFDQSPRTKDAVRPTPALFKADGTLDAEKLNALLRQRNDRHMDLQE